MDDTPRWSASVTYRHDEGTRTVTRELVELEELAEIVEAGPHWDTIVKIEVWRTADANPLTVEEAEKL